MKTPSLFVTVDGLEFDDEDAPYDGDGQFPPFRLFIPNAQAYLAGDYQTRDEAQAEADKINRGDYTPAEDSDREAYTVTFWADDGLGAYTRRVRAKNPAEAVYRAVSGAMPSVTATCRKAKFRAVAFPHARPDLTETFGGGLDGLALLDGITRPAGR